MREPISTCFRTFFSGMVSNKATWLKKVPLCRKHWKVSTVTPPDTIVEGLMAKDTCMLYVSFNISADSHPVMSYKNILNLY